MKMDLSAARIAVELLDGYLNGKEVSEACEENMIEPEEFLQKEFDQVSPEKVPRRDHFQSIQLALVMGGRKNR